MAVLNYLPTYKTTTLSVVGGIDASQTTGIVISDVTGIDTDKPGVLCMNYSTPLDTDLYELISFTSIDGSKELQGVTRGADGTTGRSHNNSVTAGFVISKSHINNINDKLTGEDADCIVDPNGNEILATNYVASAVNEMEIKNAAANGDVQIAAIGGDTDIDIIIKGKGTGGVKLGTGTVSVTDIVDQDDMSDNSAVKLATQQSIKAYVDSKTELFRTITYVIDGGGAVIGTGIAGDLEIPFGCTIGAVTALADQSGSIVVDVWKDTYANYPPTDADTITASAPVTISTATKSQDTTLTGWTTSITAGDTLRFNVDSCTSITRVTLSLKVSTT